jgi:hypothetical protein
MADLRGERGSWNDLADRARLEVVRLLRGRALAGLALGLDCRAVVSMHQQLCHTFEPDVHDDLRRERQEIVGQRVAVDRLFHEDFDRRAVTVHSGLRCWRNLATPCLAKPRRA